MTLRQRLAEAAARLAAAGIDTGVLDARVLLQHVLDVDRSWLVAHDNEALPVEQAEQYDALMARRASREPVAYILGEKEFWGLPFFVTTATLIPRPDSETLIEAALGHIVRESELRVLDLGTGSGCLLLSILLECPRARGLGIDRSADALAVASRNAERLSLRERAEFQRGNWGEGIDDTFDLILCNPPYVALTERPMLTADVLCEPASALFAGENGLDDYRKIAPDIARLLAKTGKAVIEIGSTQADDVVSIMRAAGLSCLERKRDLAGCERALVFELTSA